MRYDDSLNVEVHDDEEDAYIQFCADNDLDPDAKRTLIIWHEQMNYELEGRIEYLTHKHED